VPSRGDAEGQPRNLLSGVSDTTHRRSRSARRFWVHPYTGEVRDLVEEVETGTLEMTPIGFALVADLCVEGANHYISEIGLVNKNTRVYVEECGTFPSYMPIAKLHATLRSSAGVPCRIRLTGNPGGVGHSWVKARYIDPCPKGWKVVTDPDTGLQ